MCISVYYDKNLQDGSISAMWEISNRLNDITATLNFSIFRFMLPVTCKQFLKGHKLLPVTRKQFLKGHIVKSHNEKVTRYKNITLH